MTDRDVNTYIPIDEKIIERFKARLDRELERYTEHTRLIKQGKGYVGATIIRATDAEMASPATYDIIEVNNLQLFYAVDEGKAMNFLYNDGEWLIVGYWEGIPHASEY